MENWLTSPFTFTLLSRLTPVMPVQACGLDNNNAYKLDTGMTLLFFIPVLLYAPFSSSFSSFLVCMHTSRSSVGVWRSSSPPPKCEMCGLNGFATNYTNFASA